MRRPQRTCIVCRAHGDKTALLRLAYAAADAPGMVAGFAVGAAAVGRGAYLHTGRCLEQLEGKHLIAASTSNRRAAGRASVAQRLKGSTLTTLRNALAASASINLPCQQRGGIAAA